MVYLISCFYYKSTTSFIDPPNLLQCFHPFKYARVRSARSAPLSKASQRNDNRWAIKQCRLIAQKRWIVPSKLPIDSNRPGHSTWHMQDIHIIYVTKWSSNNSTLRARGSKYHVGSTTTKHSKSLIRYNWTSRLKIVQVRRQYRSWVAPSSSACLD